MVPSSVTRVDAARRRAAALVRVSELAASDPRLALQWLFAAALEDPALLRVRLWRVDQALFGSSRRAALLSVRAALLWCGDDRVSGYVSLAWVLDGRTGGARLSAWLLAVSLREGVELPGPNPYLFAEP